MGKGYECGIWHAIPWPKALCSSTKFPGPPRISTMYGLVDIIDHQTNGGGRVNSSSIFLLPQMPTPSETEIILNKDINDVLIEKEALFLLQKQTEREAEEEMEEDTHEIGGGWV